MLLGAPWLSAACIKYAALREPGKITFDMDATCEAYIKSVMNVMSLSARLAMARKARRSPNWRRMTWHMRWAEFKDGLSNALWTSHASPQAAAEMRSESRSLSCHQRHHSLSFQGHPACGAMCCRKVAVQGGRP